MIKKAVEKRNVNSELFSIILPLIPNLLLKSGWAFVRFKMDAKKGGSIFQKELMNQGLLIRIMNANGCSNFHSS